MFQINLQPDSSAINVLFRRLDETRMFCTGKGFGLNVVRRVAFDYIQCNEAPGLASNGIIHCLNGAIESLGGKYCWIDVERTTVGQTKQRRNWGATWSVSQITRVVPCVWKLKDAREGIPFHPGFQSYSFTWPYLISTKRWIYQAQALCDYKQS